MNATVQGVAPVLTTTRVQEMRARVRLWWVLVQECPFHAGHISQAQRVINTSMVGSVYSEHEKRAEEA